MSPITPSSVSREASVQRRGTSFTSTTSPLAAPANHSPGLLVSRKTAYTTAAFADLGLKKTPSASMLCDLALDSSDLLAAAAGATSSPCSPSPAQQSTPRRKAAGRCAAAAAGAAAAVMSAAPLDLHDYILDGPLLATCNLSPTAADLSEWIITGRQLALQLDFDHDNLDAIQRLRIYHYYLPIFFWARGQLASHKASGSTNALVLGISAPQGCGKTTIVEQLELLFHWSGQRAASVSIDDFYLTYADQTALAAGSPDNKLLQYRGNAGTHDLALGTETVQRLRALTQPGSSMQVPRYDKSAYAGRGDRAPAAAWPAVQGPLDVVLFEGWMSGFTPLSDSEIAALGQPDLARVNDCLRAYSSAWDSLVDSWLVVRIGDPQWVYKWRLQAEEKMRASGKAGMTDAQIADFVSRFMPAYAAYLPQLYRGGPTTAKAGRTLIIEVDQNRSPVAVQPPAVV